MTHIRTVGPAVLIALLLLAGAVAPTTAASATLTTSGSRYSGAVALTFDDGYNRSACRSIARTLRKHHAKGTFFINGIHLRRNPSAWRAILKGQPVGNHTRSHPNLTHLSNRAIKKQIRQNEAIHESILGRHMLKLLRPPYGAQDYRVRQLAGSLGYKRTVLWNVDTYDWRSSATVSSVIARATGARPGSIILMHCARSVTPLALPAIIRHYKARGIKLLGLKRVLGL